MTTLTDLVTAMQARAATRQERGEPPAYIVEADATETPVTWSLSEHGTVQRYPGGRRVRVHDGAELATTGWGYPAG